MNAKDAISSSAIELFSKRGFDGVSIRDIANLAGVHFSSIRYHFGDKEDLYNACISKHGKDRLLSAKRFLTAEPKSVEDMRLRLGYAIDDVFRIHGENPFLTKLLLLEVESEDHRADRVLKKTMVAMSAVYSQFFKACQRKNYIKNNLDPLFMTQSLMGVLHHYMRTESIRERLLSQKKINAKNNKEQIVENIITLFLGCRNY
ncbi:MAG: TetR/AcrR family transcriptional regulator [Bdellovibrionales bacterium]|nr:TetR/AcrR family transcriptional regulator [Bdellovibrionales bacterium]